MNKEERKGENGWWDLGLLEIVKYYYQVFKKLRDGVFRKLWLGQRRIKTNHSRPVFNVRWSNQDLWFWMPHYVVFRCFYFPNLPFFRFFFFFWIPRNIRFQLQAPPYVRFLFNLFYPLPLHVLNSIFLSKLQRDPTFRFHNQHTLQLRPHVSSQLHFCEVITHHMHIFK